METKATKNYTENEVREIASKFSSRIEFMKGDKGAYRAVLAKFPHVLDEIFGGRNKHSVNQSNFTPMETKAVETCSSEHTKEEALKIASKFSSRIAFMKGDKGAYRTALKKYPEILDEIFGGRGNTSLTK